MNGSEQSIRTLVGDLIEQMQRLIRQELRLAQAEAGEKVSQGQRGLISIVVGTMFAFAALLILLQALVLAVSNAMPAWLASIVVGIVVAIIGFALVRQGQSNLKATHLVPERTLRSMRDDKEMVMEKVR